FFVDTPLMSNAATHALPNLSENSGATPGTSRFEAHPLLQLLYHRVPVYLGSDGQGTMHFSLRDNYRLAGLRVLELFRADLMRMPLPDGRRLTYSELRAEAQAGRGPFTVAEL